MINSRFLITSTMLICLLSPLGLAGQSSNLVSEMSDLAWAEEVDKARDLIESKRVEYPEPSAEWLAAVSWMARGASFAERWDVAEQYGSEAYSGSIELIKERPLDDDRVLATALGAGIEVLGRAYDAQGDRARAVNFLSTARKDFAGTSIETRIQKNFLLLSLEGQPLPDREADSYMGPQQTTAEDFKGKVALFFFWAHWCPDCKRQEPILAALHEEYGDRGLTIVGPTQLYGFTSRGQTATPEEELAYLTGEYSDQFPVPSWMGVPISKANFLNFGVSTTPTLILVDREGIVQRYNPGTLNHDELKALIEPLLMQ